MSMSLSPGGVIGGFPGSKHMLRQGRRASAVGGCSMQALEEKEASEQVRAACFFRVFACVHVCEA